MKTSGWIGFGVALLLATGCIAFGLRQLMMEDDSLALLCCLSGGFLLRAVAKSLDVLEGAR